MTDPLVALCKTALESIGENPDREGLQRTPERYAKMLREVTSGYGEDLNSIVNDAIFVGETSELVTVRNIDFYSLCEHHLVPFFGKVHVGYLPNAKIIGLSKIPRIVQMFARRLQVQERITEQVAETLQTLLAPHGVICMVAASHLCSTMRGVQSQNSSMVTVHSTGLFRSDSRARQEFLSLIKT